MNASSFYVLENSATGESFVKVKLLKELPKKNRLVGWFDGWLVGWLVLTDPA